jgi:hypothetical protein
MIPIDTLFNTHSAERMAAFSDLRVFVSLTTDHALSKLLDDVINADLKGLIVPTFVFY